MATKKKHNKAAGKTKASKTVTQKGPASSKKSTPKKVATKIKTVKAKKSVASKKSVAKTKKPTASAKKAKPATSSKKKAAPSKKPTTKLKKSPSAVKKTKSTVASKKTTAAPSTQAKKKKTNISRWKVAKKVTTPKGKAPKKVTQSKTSTAKKAAIQKSVAQTKAKSSSKSPRALSPQERYNAGGLCACVIETFTQTGQSRLRQVLKHLGLSDMDQANLFRVSQGLRIPKLFADGLASEESRRGVLQELTQIAKGDDPSGKRWKTDLEDLARLLGD